MQSTSIFHFLQRKYLISASLGLLTIISSGHAALMSSQCQFSPYLKCVDQNGVELWGKPAINDVSKLALDAKRIYLQQNNQVLSFNRNSGKLLWKANSGADALFFFPILDQQTIYLARSDGRLEKRQASTGKLQWSKQTGDGWVYPPIATQGQLITGGQDRTIWLLDSDSGETRSNFMLSQELVMPLSSAHGLIFASTFDGAISALKLKTTTNPRLGTVWASQMTSPVFDIQSSERLLITADMGGIISALDPLNGKLIWQQPVHKNALYWNVLHQQTLYSLSESGLLSVLDLHSGNLLSQQQFTGIFSRPPIVRGESLVLFDTHGKPQQVLLKTLTSGQATTLFTFNQTRIL